MPAQGLRQVLVNRGDHLRTAPFRLPAAELIGRPEDLREALLAEVIRQSKLLLIILSGAAGRQVGISRLPDVADNRL
ncbi:hypothetical protein GCM10011507_32710 [Edaphobacter acidisoli]|uniref:Uncharacterized protein n=1 Tax=Edaphobacter acidisoli TaxID=2040573 RepID=A0A916S0B1_9BACT|nr:hypothetical protein GCM10011507_32710 [Edaphobacter acidisoli]